MYGNLVKNTICAGLILALGACGLFSDEKIKLEGERLSVLSGSAKLQPDYPEGKVKIKLPEPVRNPRWSQDGGNSEHIMGHLAASSRLKKFWDAGFGEGSSKRDMLIAKPIIAHRVVFAIDADAIVTARRLDSGDQIWKKRLKPRNEDDKSSSMKGAGLAYFGKKIYATTGFGGVFALDMLTGRELWRYDAGMPIRIAPTANADKLFVQTIDNTLIALNSISGEEVWRYKTKTEDTTLVGGAAPAYSPYLDVVIAAFSNGELRAFKSSTGTPLWADNLISRKRNNSLANIAAIKADPVIDNDKIFAIGNSDILAAIDLKTGMRIWEREVSGTNQPWVAGQYLYVLSDNNELLALNKNDGKIIWNTEIPNVNDKPGEFAVGPILVNNRLLVPTSDGHVFSISPYNGKLIGFINIDEDIDMAPIVADGVVIFTTNEAEMLAYK